MLKAGVSFFSWSPEPWAEYVLLETGNNPEKNGHTGNKNNNIKPGVE
jgi:hypothetical protein